MLISDQVALGLQSPVLNCSSVVSGHISLGGWMVCVCTLPGTALESHFLTISLCLTSFLPP